MRPRLPRSVIVVCAALALCTSPVPSTGKRTEDVPAPRAERTYAYGPHPRQQLAVHWRAEGAGRTGKAGRAGDAAALRPGLVVLHGGYWRLDRAPGWREWSGSLTERGLVVFDVDYRRNVDARWPAQRRDVLTALAWIARHGARFGAAPDRLVLLGSSAGGHLATSAGTYGAGRSRVAAVIGLSPITDPRRAWNAGADAGFAGEPRASVRRNAERLAGCRPQGGIGSGSRSGDRSGSGSGDRSEGGSGDGACAAVWRDMDAASHASGADDAPMLLVHSAHDFVSPAHSHALARAERASGMRARAITVVTVRGGAHGGALLREPRVMATVLAWAEARTVHPPPRRAIPRSHPTR